ncbi:MAG: ribonuclease HII [Bacillota bacterium]
MTFDKMTISDIKAYLVQHEELCDQELELLKADQRQGVANLLQSYQRREERALAEKSRLQKMLDHENYLLEQGFEMIAGTDEAGRGPLAGPVVAAAVILDPVNWFISGLNDSKMLAKASREKLFEQLVINARSYAIASASRAEIDQLNIHAASLLAMNRALLKLSCEPDFVLVDGFAIKGCPFHQKAIKGGDALSMSIAAASVLAKVARDKIMDDLHKYYPQYGFDRNKGYGTEAHRQALKQFGPCPEHRRSFRLNACET